jgi:hypothetical protein
MNETPQTQETTSKKSRKLVVKVLRWRIDELEEIRGRTRGW